MIRIGIADYGMNVRYGGFYDYEERMDRIREIGYDGLERLTPTDAADALRKASALALRGMGFATCNASDIEYAIKWTAAFGKKYIWCDNLMGADSFDALCLRANYLQAACEKYGICCAIHNHLGSPVESQAELEEFLARCPGVGMIFDIGHLGAADGNVQQIFDKYFDRIKAIHLKDWKLDAEKAVWLGKGYFCALGKGELEAENRYVVKEALKRNFDGWILVEQDTHLREPLEDLRESRELIRSWGI